MELIKPELKRIDVKRGDKEKHTELMTGNFTGFVVYERHPNGKIAYEKEWLNGRDYGYQVEYYDNGQVKYYHQMDDFNDIGPSKAYWEDGSIRHEETGDYTRQYDKEGNITYEVGNGVVKEKAEDYTL